MDIAKELKNVLIEGGFTEPIYIYGFPADKEGIQLRITPGFDSDVVLSYPSLQVVTKFKKDSCILADSIRDYLSTLRFKEINGGVFYVIKPKHEVIYMGQDDKGRLIYNCNYLITLERYNERSGKI